MVAADVASPAYFARRLGSVRSIGFSVGITGNDWPLVTLTSGFTSPS